MGRCAEQYAHPVTGEVLGSAPRTLQNEEKAPELLSWPDSQEDEED